MKYLKHIFSIAALSIVLHSGAQAQNNTCITQKKAQEILKAAIQSDKIDSLKLEEHFYNEVADNSDQDLDSWKATLTQKAVGNLKWDGEKYITSRSAPADLIYNCAASVTCSLRFTVSCDGLVVDVETTGDE